MDKEYQFPELETTDLVYLDRQYRMFGWERALGWVRSKVALSTDLELKELNGEEVNKDRYYRKATAYYLNIDDPEE